jgi:Flp pilus assembly pilin Flp
MSVDRGDSREGQGLVEYALIMLLVAVAVFTAVSLLAPKLDTVFARVSASLAI